MDEQAIQVTVAEDGVVEVRIVLRLEVGPASSRGSAPASDPVEAMFPGRLVVGFDELAPVLGVSAATLGRMAARGEIEARQIGGRRKVVSLDELRRLLGTHAVSDAS